MAVAATPTATGTPVVPVVACRVCDRPVRTARSRAARLGEGCRRKQRARWQRRYQQLSLLPVAAAAGRTDPAHAARRQKLFELDQITSALVAEADRLEARVTDVARRPQSPDPQQPHPYEADPTASHVTDWRGKPAVPCLVCQRPRKHSIHRRARQPRTVKPDPRQALVNAAWRDRERALLGERDDD